MCLVATAQPYVLQILHDNDAPNPRKTYDNLGKMICWHRRYNLGDVHYCKTPREFLEELAIDSVPVKNIVNYVRNGKANNVKLEYDQLNNEWAVVSYDTYYNEWFTCCIFRGNLQDGEHELAESIINVISMQDLLVIVHQKNVILSLYLYDHSILHISFSSFIGRVQHAEWDSGQVGWIYISHEDVIRQYGAITSETLGKAENLLRAEVKTYDCYLSNQCHGFKLYKDGAEEDSCWGFLGNIGDVKQVIAEYLPIECNGMVENMEEIKERDFITYLLEHTKNMHPDCLQYGE